jgi:DNA-binding transcriptional ArsR family regulator
MHQAKDHKQLLHETARTLRVLGHPARLQILSILSRTGGQGLPVKSIQQPLHTGQPETSKHLIVMRANGILKSEKRNGFTFYRISTELSCLSPLIRFIRNIAE